MSDLFATLPQPSTGDGQHLGIAQQRRQAVSRRTFPALRRCCRAAELSTLTSPKPKVVSGASSMTPASVGRALRIGRQCRVLVAHSSAELREGPACRLTGPTGPTCLLPLLHLLTCQSCILRDPLVVGACTLASSRALRPGDPDANSPHHPGDPVYSSAMSASEPRGGLPRAVPTGTMLLRHIRRSALHQIPVLDHNVFVEVTASALPPPSDCALPPSSVQC